MNPSNTERRILTHGEMLELRRWNTPTIYNGWEQITKHDAGGDGFNIEETVDFMPQMGAMVGYAVTIVCEPGNPAHKAANPRAWSEYRRYVASLPGPKIVVVQDLNKPDFVGSFWGEVNANTFRAHGCVGVVTDGGVRDVDEVEALGFHYFARAVIVSHAYVHVEESGIPVEIGGLTIRPGDLIHADKHGVMTIPQAIAGLIPEAARRIEARERALIDYCQSAEFTSQGLRELQRTLPQPQAPDRGTTAAGSYA